MRAFSMAVLAGALALSACGTTPAEDNTGLPADDSCGAGGLQWLVGRSKDEIPATLPARSVRIVADNQPVTLDYSPDRLNVIWDHQTMRVKEVRCG